MIRNKITAVITVIFLLVFTGSKNKKGNCPVKY